MVAFAPFGGNSVLFYVKITLTNSQATGTGVNFQDLLTINSSTYSAYLAANLSNVNFQLGDGTTIVKSWLESGETNASTATKQWLLLASNIPAGGTATIYMCFYGLAVNVFDGINTGAEPNYTGTYGQYDNGAQVFITSSVPYQNFAGVSTPAGWSLVAGSTSQNNGITITGGGLGNGLVTTTSGYVHNAAILVDYYGLVNSTGGSNVVFGFTKLGGALVGGTGWEPNAGTAMRLLQNAGDSAWAGAPANNTTHIWTFRWTSTTSQDFQYDYGTVTTTALSSPDTASLVFGLAALNAGTAAGTIQWVRSRVYPPSGVMPSASFGGIALALMGETYNGSAGQVGTIAGEIYA